MMSQNGTWLPWIKFFLNAVAVSAEEACQQADGVMALRQDYHRRFQTDRSSARIIRLIDELFQTPSTTINRAARVLKLSHQGAANNIHKLEEAGILREITGRKRNQMFLADKIVSFMYDRPDDNGNA